MSMFGKVELQSRHWGALGLAAMGVTILATGRGMEYLGVIIPALVALMSADKVIAEVRKNRSPSPPT